MKARLLPAARALLREGWRYFLASALALALDFVLLVSLTRYAGLPYLVSAASGFCAGTLITYALSVTWVFGQRPVKDRRVEVMGFFLIGLAGLGLNELLMKLFVDGAHLNYVLAKVPTAGIGFCTNFAMRRLLLFTHRGASPAAGGELR